jgi:hypothetical protein
MRCAKEFGIFLWLDLMMAVERGAFRLGFVSEE